MSTLAIPKIEVSQEETILATEINGLAPITKVETEEEYVSAVGFLSELKKKEVKVHEFFDSDVSKAYDLHRSLTGKRKVFLDAITNIRLKIDSLCSVYRARKEKERVEKERLEQEEAHKKQTTELLEEAAALERAGDKLGAESVLAEAQNSPPPVVVVASMVPKVPGSYVRDLPWQFEVVKPELVRDEFWCPDMDAIAGIVKSKGNLAEQIVGKGSIRVWRGQKTITKS